MLSGRKHMIRTYLIAATSAAVLAVPVTAFAQQGQLRTAEEAKAMLMKALAAVKVGTYTATDADKTIGLHIDRSSIPNLNGTDGIRLVTSFLGDEMTWTNPAPLGGGTIN